MPNLPVAQVQGRERDLLADDGDQEQLADVRQLMASLGMIAWCDDEAAISA